MNYNPNPTQSLTLFTYFSSESSAAENKMGLTVHVALLPHFHKLVKQTNIYQHLIYVCVHQYIWGGFPTKAL